MNWDSRNGAEPAPTFGKLPRDVLVTAWFIAFIPVVLVFFTWLALWARSHPGNQPGAYGGGPQNLIYTPYSTPSDEITEYPATQESSPAPPTSPTADPTSQATAIDQVLQQTASDRKSVGAAATDLAACGASKGLSTDVKDLLAAQADRISLANSLGGFAVDQLSGGTQAVQLLQSALQDSAAADGDYAKAGQDFSADPGSCAAAQMAQDPNYVAAQNADTTATSDKTSFTAAWNPIAQQYGLQSWDQSGF
jgi:hypothetical protein